MSISMGDGTKLLKRRRWGSFSLRTLLSVMTIVAIIAAWRGNIAIHNRMIARMEAAADREGVRIGTAPFVFGKPLYFTTSSNRYLLLFAVDDVSEVYVEDRPLAYNSEVAATARRGIVLNFAYIENLDDDAIEACLGDRTQYLRIRDSTLAPDMLSRSSHWTTVETIEIDHVPLSFESLRSVAAHPTLQWLTIEARAEDFRSLDPSTSFQSLEGFALTLAPQDSGESALIQVEDLNAISRCPQLKSLDLDTAIDNLVVMRIIEILPNLESLYLDASTLSDDSIGRLLRLPKLKHLGVSGCYLSKEAKAKASRFNQAH